MSDSDSNSDSDYRETDDEDDTSNDPIVSKREKEAGVASDTEEEDIVQCANYKRYQSEYLINICGETYYLQLNKCQRINIFHR